MKPNTDTLPQELLTITVTTEAADYLRARQLLRGCLSIFNNLYGPSTATHLRKMIREELARPVPGEETSPTPDPEPAHPPMPTEPPPSEEAEEIVYAFAPLPEDRRILSLRERLGLPSLHSK